MGFLWDFFVLPMLFPCYFYDLSMGFLWDSYGISMIFLWYFYLIPMIFLPVVPHKAVVKVSKIGNL